MVSSNQYSQNTWEIVTIMIHPVIWKTLSSSFHQCYNMQGEDCEYCKSKNTFVIFQYMVPLMKPCENYWVQSNKNCLLLKWNFPSNFFCYCFSDSNFIKWMLGVSLMHTCTNVSLIKGFWGHRRGEHSFLKFETPFLATSIHSFLTPFSLGIHIQKINVDAKTVTISANLFKGKLRHIELLHLYSMSQLEFHNCSLISIAMKVSSH
jgi:hypothetical protein